jgi:uncharacterized protein YggE
MPRLMIGLLGALFFALPVLAQVPVPTGPPAIVTKGEAVIKRAPDRAWVTISTEIREGKAADAREKSAEIVTAITGALRRAGVESDAIRTAGFSLAPEVDWSNGRSSVRGYVVRNQLEVRVDDLDKLGDVIDAANGPKNAGLSITGPRFDLKNQHAAEQDALKLAVEMAVARAQAIASGARRSLGAILRLEDQSVTTSNPLPRPMMAQRGGGGAASMEMVAETPITPGEIEVRASVVLTVAIQ